MYSRLLEQNHIKVHIGLICCQIGLYGYIFTTRLNQMFAYIPELYITAAAALVAVIVWLSCVQFSEYEVHRKKHMFDEDSKSKQLTDHFCWLYIAIPIVGGILAVFLGLMLTDYLIAHGYIADADAIYATAIFSSIVIYGILDITFFAKIGDVAYFRMIEEKFLKAVDAVPAEEPEITSEQELIILLQKLLKK